MSYFSFQFGFSGVSLAFGGAIVGLWWGYGDREGMRQFYETGNEPQRNAERKKGRISVLQKHDFSIHRTYAYAP